MNDLTHPAMMLDDDGLHSSEGMSVELDPVESAADDLERAVSRCCMAAAAGIVVSTGVLVAFLTNHGVRIWLDGIAALGPSPSSPGGSGSVGSH